MTQTLTQQPERRRAPRRRPTRSVRVSRAVPVVPISDADVVDTSAAGVALRTRTPLRIGERLSFHVNGGQTPPILAEVVACEPLPDGTFRVRCRCLLGGFDL